VHKWRSLFRSDGVHHYFSDLAVGSSDIIDPGHRDFLLLVISSHSSHDEMRDECVPREPGGIAPHWINLLVKFIEFTQRILAISYIPFSGFDPSFPIVRPIHGLSYPLVFANAER